MGARMIAGAVKMSGDVVRVGGDPEYAGAMAAAAVAAEIARLKRANFALETERRYYKTQYYAGKIAELRARMEKVRQKKPWWYDVLQFVGGCLYVAVTGFVGLLIVKEE